MRRHTPVIVIFLVAPFVGEVLSTSTPLVSPYLPVDALLYGASALLIREVVRDRGLGLIGLVCLGGAFGVFQEALLLRTWFAREHIPDEVVADYARIGGTNLIQAVHLTLFHAAVSTWCAIAIAELLLPAWRHRPWAGRRGRVLAGLGLAGLLLVSFLAPGSFYPFPPWPSYALAAGALLALVAIGLTRRGGDRRSAGWEPRAREDARGRFLAPLVAAAATAQLALTWGLPSTGIDWRWGLPLSVLPPVAAWWLARRAGPRRPPQRTLAVITGLVVPMLGVDVLVGIGRPDALAAAAVGALALWALRRRVLRDDADHEPRPALS